MKNERTTNRNPECNEQTNPIRRTPAAVQQVRERAAGNALPLEEEQASGAGAEEDLQVVYSQGEGEARAESEASMSIQWNRGVPPNGIKKYLFAFESGTIAVMEWVSRHGAWKPFDGDRSYVPPKYWAEINYPEDDNKERK